MHEDGFKSIVNMDISRTVIDQMNEKYKEKCPELQWEKLDIRQLFKSDKEKQLTEQKQ